MDEIINLFKAGRIDERQFQIYMMFAADDLGSRFFKNEVDRLLLETPIPTSNVACTYYAGRISIIRGYKEVIIGINNLRDGKNYDGSDNVSGT